MGRYFEKISYEQFKRDFKDDFETYKNYELPTRSTKHSAGYDFRAIYDFKIEPGEQKRIFTGVKVNMENDEVLMLYVRSSMGIKHGIRMSNGVGVIDSDYYNNSSNEGHLWVALQNEGDQDYIIKKGTAYCQGIFTKFLTCGEMVDNERIGGFGSTDKI